MERRGIVWNGVALCTMSVLQILAFACWQYAFPSGSGVCSAIALEFKGLDLLVPFHRIQGEARAIQLFQPALEVV
jgi:hypothetical protein